MTKDGNQPNDPKMAADFHVLHTSAPPDQETGVNETTIATDRSTGRITEGASATNAEIAVSDRSNTSRKRRVPVRIVALAVVVASVGAMVAVDRLVDRQPTVSSGGGRIAIGPVATDASSSLSTWFCAGGSMAGAKDDMVISVANPTRNPATGSITFYGDAGEREVLAIAVPAMSQTSASARSRLNANHVAALVELDVGGIAVDHRIEQDGLSSISPCASSPSTSWFFADGATEVGSTMELSLFNPFGEDAIVDLRFATDQGPAEPAALQGFVVARNSVISIDVGSFVRRRSVVSVAVQARVGRLVVDEVQKTDARPRGLALASGAQSPSASWFFPNGRSTSKLKERYVLFNPTEQDISAQIDFIVEGAESEPFEIDIPKLSQAELVPGDESRIPIDVGYSVVVATDGPNLVATRTLVATSSLRSGRAITLGAARVANRWLVPDAMATRKRDDRLAFLNPTDTDAAVTVSFVANGQTTPIPGLERVLLSSGQRLGVRVGDYAALEIESALLVESEGAPVIVERTSSGISASAAGGEQPLQPVLVTVDANIVLPPPDADSGVDEGDSSPIDTADQSNGPSTTVAATTSANAVGPKIVTSGGRLIGVGVRLISPTIASTTIVPRTTTSSRTTPTAGITTTSRPTAPTRTPTSAAIAGGPSTTLAFQATLTANATGPATTTAARIAATTSTTPVTNTVAVPRVRPITSIVTSTSSGASTSAASRSSTSSGVSTSAATPSSTTAAILVTTTTKTTTTKTAVITTSVSPVTTTTVPSSVIVVPRPTRATGSTSSAIAIPLDLG